MSRAPPGPLFKSDPRRLPARFRSIANQSMREDYSAA